MIRSSRSLLRFRLVFFCFLAILPHQAALGADTLSPPPPVRICFMPCADVVKTYKKTRPLTDYLENALARKIIILVPNDYREFRRIVQQGDTDFVFQFSTTYFELEDSYRQTDLLTSLSVTGKASCGALLVTRSDSGLNRIDDLRGKTILFGPEHSTAKTIAAKKLLRENGIDPDQDLAEYRYGDTCKQIALNVFLKTADAGFICSDKYSLFAAGRQSYCSKEDCWPFPASALKVIAKTEENPGWIISAMKSADQGLHLRLKQALLALNHHDHQKILAQMESGGFAEIQTTELQILRGRLH